MSTEWVALMNWAAEDVGILYEEGGIYRGVDGDKPRCKFAAESEAYRKLEPGEETFPCPRCGMRFIDKQSRDLHFDGDEDFPSICKDMPNRLRLVQK